MIQLFFKAHNLTAHVLLFRARRIQNTKIDFLNAFSLSCISISIAFMGGKCPEGLMQELQGLAMRQVQKEFRKIFLHVFVQFL